MKKDPEPGWSDPHFMHVTDDNVVVMTSYKGPDGSVSLLRVWFDPEDENRVQSVRLSMPGRMTPTEIRRFPWSVWLEVADIMARDNSEFRRRVMFDSPQELPTKEAVGAGNPSSRVAGQAQHPGRRGHPDSHYRRIAARYIALLKVGVRNPTATIATEEFVNRNTVAGWLRGARDRGYLPPARRGRPG